MTVPFVRLILLLFIRVAAAQVALVFPDDISSCHSGHWIPRSALRQAAARQAGLLYTGNTNTRWIVPLCTAASGGAIVLIGALTLSLTKYRRKRAEASGHLRTGLSGGHAGHINFPDDNCGGADDKSLQSDDDSGCGDSDDYGCDESTDYRHMVLRSSNNYWPSFTVPNTAIAATKT